MRSIVRVDYLVQELHRMHPQGMTSTLHRAWLSVTYSKRKWEKLWLTPRVTNNCRCWTSALMAYHQKCFILHVHTVVRTYAPPINQFGCIFTCTQALPNTTADSHLQHTGMPWACYTQNHLLQLYVGWCMHHSTILWQQTSPKAKIRHIKFILMLKLHV